MNIKRIGEDIFVYPNFLDAAELQQINDDIAALGDGGFTEPFEGAAAWHATVSSAFEIVTNKINNLLREGYHIRQHSQVMRMTQGATWGEHTDNADFLHLLEQAESLQEGEPYDEVEYPVYGLVVYFNQFEGGQLEYTTQGIIYPPKPGDLVMHGAGPECSHQVLEVTSPVRFSYSNAIYITLKVPKS